MVRGVRVFYVFVCFLSHNNNKMNITSFLLKIDGTLNVTALNVLLLLYMQACFTTLLASCHAGLLGAGTGEGSCPAAPFRANPSSLKYTVCPQHASCCSEFGYCRPRSEWELGNFRSVSLVFTKGFFAD